MNFFLIAIFILWNNINQEVPQKLDEQLKPSASNIIFQSLDGGKTWQDASNGLPDKLELRGFYADHEVILLGHEHGLYRKSLNTCGSAWKHDFLVDQPIFKFYPGKGGFYAISLHNSLIQELNGSGVWRPVFPGMNTELIQSVLETPDGNIFLGCRDGIFKSTDRGSHWKQVYAGDMVTSMVFNDNTIWAAGACGLLQSDDKGEHWNSKISNDYFVSKIAVIDARVFIISNRHGNWRDVTSNPDYRNRISYSSDNGISWKHLDENLSMVRFINITNENRAPNRQINDFEQIGSTLFCSLDNGLYRSLDSGKTWKLVLSTSGNKVFKLAVSGNMIYAVSVFNGC